MILPLAQAATDCVASPVQRISELWNVVWQFLSLSLFSLGGGNTLLAEYHHISVDRFCWISNQQFADLYALAEAAPGPSSMIVGLLGMAAAHNEGLLWKLISACAAEIAVLLPSSLLMLLASLMWRRFEHSPWRVALEKGLGPITLGILFAVGLKILHAADTNILGILVSIIVCVLMLRTRLSPLLFMAVAGLLGGFGWINR
jgi:chromate transporter